MVALIDLLESRRQNKARTWQTRLDQTPSASELPQTETVLGEEPATSSQPSGTEEAPVPPEAQLNPVVPEIKVEEGIGEVSAETRLAYNGSTALTLYVREIGRVKPLTPREETDLLARIKRGDKKAREKVVKANLRLVVKIARDYEGMGLPLLDLISEGNVGLMKAIERFDPANGSKLSARSSWWIRRSIKRALTSQSKVFRR